jgi:hypothetical protein
MKLISGLAAVALATTALAQPASAATTPVSPSRIAGDWIATQLTDGLAVGDYGIDAGLSIDAGLAFDAIGDTARAGSVADSIGATLVTSDAFPYGYTQSDEGTQVGYYANATAKAAAFTQRVGRDPRTAYADVDLIAQLEDLTDDSSGRIADDSSFGNYENTIGQGFAVEALARAGSSEAAAATGALLDQQCPAGFFLFTLGATSCAAVPSPDTTALAVISLRESGIASTRVAAAVSLATQWLESVQLSDGSFAGDSSAPGSNANSTGLAGWALGEAGRTAAAAKAAGWIRGLQVSDAGACATKAPTGAIAYNADDLASARTAGLGAKVGVWRRATFQAAPALVWAPAATAPLGIATPATAADKGTVTATVRGLAAGEHGCVSLGASARPVTGTGSDVTVPFQLPAGSGSYALSVTTLGGTESSTTTVPAPVSPTPTAEPVVGDLTTSKVEKVKNNAFQLAVSCDSTEACAGKLKVRTVRKVELANGTVRRLLVAKTDYSVAAGRTATVRLALQRPARHVLGSKRLRVEATQTARGADAASTTFWLRRK